MFSNYPFGVDVLMPRQFRLVGNFAKFFLGIEPVNFDIKTSIIKL